MRVLAASMVGLAILFVYWMFRVPVLENEGPAVVPVVVLVVGTGLLIASALLRFARLQDPVAFPISVLISPTFVVASLASILLLGRGELSISAPLIPIAAVWGVITGGLLSRIANRDEVAQVEAAARRNYVKAIALYRRIAERRATRVVSRTVAFTIATTLFFVYNIAYALLLIGAIIWLVFEVGSVTGVRFTGLAKAGAAGVASVAGWAGRGVIHSWRELRLATRAWDHRPGLRKLEAKEVPALTEIIADLGEAMIGTRTPFSAVVLDTYSRAAAPSVIAMKAHHLLLVTPRLVALTYKSPRAVRAMLAHEIAHMVQQDVTLWPRAMMLSRLTREFVVPMLTWHAMTSSVIVLVSGTLGGLLLATPNVVILVTSYVAVTNAYAARRASEALADLGAILFVGGAELSLALGCLSHEETSWHEPLDVRRGRAERCAS